MTPREDCRPTSALARGAGPSLLVMVASTIGFGCGETNRYVEPPPPEVTVATPVTRDVDNYFDATGTAQPVMSVDIRAGSRGSSRSGISRRGRSSSKASSFS